MWVLFALTAPALWAASNLIDVDLLKRRIRHPVTLVAVTGLFAGIPAVLIALSGAFGWPGARALVLALFAGVLGVLVYYPYFRALAIAPPDDVILMWNLAPVLIALLARAFLGERLEPPQYVAIGLLVLGSLLAARHGRHDSALSPALPWMLLASVMLAVAAVLEKAVFLTVSFPVGLGWISIAGCATAVATIATSRQTRCDLREARRWRTARLLLAGNELLDVTASTSLSLATALGPVSLVHAVGGLQPVFILWLAPLLAGGRSNGTPVASARRFSRLKLASLALVVAGLGLLQSTP